jgi:RNA polymerase sigma-70 factor (ECF subfamily)
MTSSLTPVPDPDDRGVRPTGSAAPSPGDLLERTARGDEEAFAALYDALGARVFGLVRRVLRDPQHAEDVTQEVFLEIWRRAGSFDPARGGGVSWVLTLAHARAVDRVRSTQAARARDTAVAQRSTVRDVDTVIEAVENALERRAVRRCLAALTDLQRESVKLAYYNGYSYAEVAALLRVPLPTVKTRMRDGLIRLRDCLEVTA